MKSARGFDLSKFEDVVPRADTIYERLADESMPCDEPWPVEKIARFRLWIDQGKHP